MLSQLFTTKTHPRSKHQFIWRNAAAWEAAELYGKRPHEVLYTFLKRNICMQNITRESNACMFQDKWETRKWIISPASLCAPYPVPPLSLYDSLFCMWPPLCVPSMLKEALIFTLAMQEPPTYVKFETNILVLLASCCNTKSLEINETLKTNTWNVVCGGVKSVSGDRYYDKPAFLLHCTVGLSVPFQRTTTPLQITA